LAERPPDLLDDVGRLRLRVAGADELPLLVGGGRPGDEDEVAGADGARVPDLVLPDRPRGYAQPPGRPHGRPPASVGFSGRGLILVDDLVAQRHALVADVDRPGAGDESAHLVLLLAAERATIGLAPR